MTHHTASTGEATMTATITHADGTVETFDGWNLLAPPTPVPGVVGAYYQVVALVRDAAAALPGGRATDRAVQRALAGGQWLAEIRQGARVTAALAPHPRHLTTPVPAATFVRLRRAGAIVPQPGWAPEYYRSGEIVTYYCLAEASP